MQKSTSWCDILRKVIEDPFARQQLADRLGVSSITLTRWVKQETKPRLQNLHNLVIALPEYRDQLLPLLEEAFPDFSVAVLQQATTPDYSVIPSSFYKRVMHTVVHTPRSLLFSLLCDLILEQALKQLDPNRLGMAIVLVCCMPPASGQKVRSLREVLGRGTPPWREHLEQQARLLGIESLAGHVVTSGHLEVNHFWHISSGIAPGYRRLWEESAAAAPLLRAGEVAGSLLVSSTQSDYFSALRCALIEQYAELLTLAFAPHQFYEPERIELLPLPAYDVQLPMLSRFRQRVTAILTESARDGAPIHLLEAEQMVWQEIEADLFSAPSPLDEHHRT